MLLSALEITLLVPAVTHGPENAEWLSYERTKLDYVHERMGARRLASSENSSQWAPMRIYAHTDELRKDVSDFSPATLRYLVDDLIPASIRWLSQTLRVRPVQGPLKFEQTCSAEFSDGDCSIGSESLSCGLADIPRAHLKEREICSGSGVCQVSRGGEGIRNADFAIVHHV